MKKLRFVLALIMVPGILLAVGNGKIRGKVTGGDNKEALVGATVAITGTTLGAATDPDGNYIILNVPAGTYTLKANYVGYQTITQTNILVSADLTTEANFQLPLEGVTVPTVEIRAERPLVNKNATNAVRLIDKEFFSNLPARGVDAAVALQPGVVQQGNNVYIRGGRSDETGYTLEGVNISNPLYGGRGVTFSDAAVEQIQVQAGTFSAQYGNANAGIVGTQLKTGGSDGWKPVVQIETDNFASQGDKALGTYSYGYSDYTLSLSGPISGKTLRFAGTAQNTFYRSASIDATYGTPTPVAWDGYNFAGANSILSDPTLSYLHPTTASSDTLNLFSPAGNQEAGGSNQYLYSGTLLFDQSPLQIRLAGSYRDQTAHDPVAVANVLDYMRTPEHVFKDASGNLKGSYAFDTKNFLEVNLTYSYLQAVTRDPLLQDNFDAYGDSAANARLGFVFLGESSTLPPYTVFSGQTGISINQPGTPIAGYNKIIQTGIGGRADFTSQVNTQHELKFGGEYNRDEIRRFNPPSVNSRSKILADTSGPGEAILLRGTYGIDNYGYDVYGNEISNDVMVGNNVTDFGPRHPVFAAGYVQDKMEISDVVVTAGLRYDHIDSDSPDFVDPTHLIFVDSLKVISGQSLKKTEVTNQLSPRLGFSFPVTDRTIFHAGYGKFIQLSQLRNSYLGMGSIYHEITGGNFVLNTVGYGLLPTRTTSYEMGFQQQFSDLASFDITAFYKDIRDQVQYTQILPGAGSTQKAYPAFINGDFSTTQGVEVAFTLRRTHRVQAKLNYTFSNASTTGSNPQSLAGAVVASTGGPFIPHYIEPADFNETHRGNVSLDYRFDKGDGGPVWERLGINLLAQFNSGHPFTLLKIDGLQVTDPRFRVPQGEINSWTTPWFFQLDGRIDKMVTLAGIESDFYIYVQNILGTLNATAAYPRTGDPGNDGWFATPSGIGAAQAEGSQYVAYYNAINNGANSLNYGPPRQIRFGLKLEF